MIPGQEDLLQEGVATYSSILAWRIPGDRGTWAPDPHTCLLSPPITLLLLVPLFPSIQVKLVFQAPLSLSLEAPAVSPCTPYTPGLFLYTGECFL